MGQTSRPIRPKDQRVSIDPVTGERVVVVLDSVQLAFERIWQTIDGQMLKLGIADREKLASRLVELCEVMRRSDWAEREQIAQPEASQCETEGNE